MVFFIKLMTLQVLYKFKKPLNLSQIFKIGRKESQLGLALLKQIEISAKAQLFSVTKSLQCPSFKNFWSVKILTDHIKYFLLKAEDVLV